MVKLQADSEGGAGWYWYELLDGRPILVVTTNSADKLGIFEEQRLRVFVPGGWLGVTVEAARQAP